MQQALLCQTDWLLTGSKWGGLFHSAYLFIDDPAYFPFFFPHRCSEILPFHQSDHMTENEAAHELINPGVLLSTAIGTQLQWGYSRDFLSPLASSRHADINNLQLLALISLCCCCSIRLCYPVNSKQLWFSWNDPVSNFRYTPPSSWHTNL